MFKTGLLLALFASAVCAGDLQDDLKARRARLMEKLDAGTILVVRSAPHRTYSLDVEYEYRQDSSFYYLAGIDEPDCTLVLLPGAAQRQILFTPEKDPVREHWDGKRQSIDEAKAATGVDAVYTNARFDAFLEALLSGNRWTPERYAPPSTEFDAFIEAVQQGKAKLAVVLDQPVRTRGPVPELLAWANSMRDRYPGIAITNATRIVHNLRQVKSPFEQRLLSRSGEISSEAHMAGMRAARPGAAEYEVKAVIEEVYRRRGALSPGYPSITGSGPNATTLHYSRANRRMDAGDLMLVDAAANFDYYTVDITRTYPVNGRFSDAQKDIYNIVLQAQDEARKVAASGAKPDDVHNKTVEVIKAGLHRLGLVADTASDEWRTWYTHGSVHYLGIDVHDVGDRSLPLAPGQAFVIEPGIYIRADALDNLPKTDKNLAFIAKVKPAFEKYKGIGIRIEDSFVLTERGLECLSSKVPRTVEEIEAFLRAEVARPR